MPSPYDRTAERYDHAIAPLEKHLLARLRVEALALIPSSTTILELGAGTGANFGLYPRCEQAVASELSFNMLEIAKGKTQIDLARPGRRPTTSLSRKSFRCSICDVGFLHDTFS